MIPTNEQISALSGKDLVDAYNELAAVAQKTPVTRFATRVDGVRRTANLAEVVRGTATRADPTPAPVVSAIEAATGPLNGAAVNPTDALADEPAPAPKPAAPKAKPAKPAAPKAKAAEPAAPKARSIASRCRELFATHDNAQIFAVLQEEFGLGDDRRWYPGWYRADARRKGK